MDLERKIQRMRSEGPMKEAADKEAAARRAKQEMDQLKRAAAGEEQDAEAKRAEADRVAKVRKDEDEQVMYCLS
jgi:transcription elongation GreA/GreB family factor